MRKSTYFIGCLLVLITLVLSCSKSDDSPAVDSYASIKAEFGTTIDPSNLANYAAQPKPAYIVKDNTDDSWKLFLDMAEKYKKAGGKLATIYIDPELKNVLDRLKYAGDERLPTAAILSSIVARFIYDHEDQIRKIIFGGKLI